MRYLKSIPWRNVATILLLSTLILGVSGFALPPAAGLSPLPPVGSILAYAGDAEPPPGWTVCDGKIIDAAHGFKKEAVNNAWWNRKVPDLNGRFLRGTTEATQVAKNGGSDQIKNLKTSNDGSHQHEYSLPTKTGRITEDEPGSNAGGGDFGHGYNLVVHGGAYAKKGSLSIGDMVSGMGNHGHYIEGGAKQTPKLEGSHEHVISEFTVIPNYTSVRYIIRIY